MEREQLEQSAEPAQTNKQAVKRKLVYTPAEVAAVMNVTRRTVYTWITDQTIPAFKVGVKLWGVRAHVVDALVEGSDVWRAEAEHQGELLRKKRKSGSGMAFGFAFQQAIKQEKKARSFAIGGTARPASPSTAPKIPKTPRTPQTLKAEPKAEPKPKTEPETGAAPSAQTVGLTAADFADFGETWGSFGLAALPNPSSGVLAPMKNAGQKRKPGKGRRS